MSTSEAYAAHVTDLAERAAAGDEQSAKSLSCLALLAEGWRPGDPDPAGQE